MYYDREEMEEIALDRLYTERVEDVEYICEHLDNIIMIITAEHEECRDTLLKAIMSNNKEERKELFEQFLKQFYKVYYNEIMSSPELLDWES